MNHWHRERIIRIIHSHKDEYGDVNLADLGYDLLEFIDKYFIPKKESR